MAKIPIFSNVQLIPWLTNTKSFQIFPWNNHFLKVFSWGRGLIYKCKVDIVEFQEIFPGIFPDLSE